MNITNAGLRGYNPKAIVIHNDAGSNNANVKFYQNWLPGHNPELGFAHVYIASDGRLQASDFAYKAWHAGNSYANANYASWEVCQSEGDQAQFLRNEQAVLDDVAIHMKKWGLTPSYDTVKLHTELSATSCPRRSMQLHGGTIESTRNYFIAELKKRLGSPTMPSKPNDQNNTQQPNIILSEEEDDMKFTYQVNTKDGKAGGAIYYYNGLKVIALTHGDQLQIIKEIYKKTTGKELTHFVWNEGAPWHERFLQANNLNVEWARTK